MDIVQAKVEGVILANRESQRTANAVALLVVASGIGIRGVVAVVENFAAEADAIHGEVRVRRSQLNIGLVAVARAVEADAIAGPQPVILSDAELVAHAAVGTKAQTNVKGAGIALLHLIDHVHLILATAYRNDLLVDGFKKSGTIQPRFPLLDFLVIQPRAFHLAHFATQHRIAGSIVTLKANLTNRITASGIDVNMQNDAFFRLINIRRGINLRPGIAVFSQQRLNAVLSRRDFRAAVPFPR